MNFPFIDINAETGETCHTTGRTWHEQFARAYAYWAPFPWMALTAEYFYEFFDRGSDVPGPGAVHGAPHAPGTARRSAFFHPIGHHRAVCGHTYINQEGAVRQRRGQQRDARGQDSFWVADASISYRLPKRLGIITLEGRNLTNEKFRFQDTDPSSPIVTPERYILLRFTLAY